MAASNTSGSSETLKSGLSDVLSCKGGRLQETGKNHTTPRPRSRSRSNDPSKSSGLHTSYWSESPPKGRKDPPFHGVPPRRPEVDDEFGVSFFEERVKTAVCCFPMKRREFGSSGTLGTLQALLEVVFTNRLTNATHTLTLVFS